MGGFSLNAIAATVVPPPATGSIYTFSADLNYDYSDLYLQISDYNNDYMGYMMDLSPYINQDVTSNFTEANSSISGQFTYNSSAPQTGTYAYDTDTSTRSRAHYNVSNESFTLNLSSANGETGQVLVGEGSSGYGFKNMYVTTASHVTSGTSNDYQSFQISGYDTNPSVTLSSSSNFDCEWGPCEGGGYFIQDYRPHDDMMGMDDALPEFFSDIESFSFELFPSLGFDEPSSDLTYQLEGVSMYLSFAGHDNLPIDNTLPDTLPALAESTYADLSLSFDTYDSDMYMYGSEVSIWDIQFTDDSPINDMFISYDDHWTYYYDKESQLYDFLSDSYLEGYADISYTLTEFELLADGLTPDTPIMPDTDTNNTDDSIFEFTFTPNSNGFTFIDPFVAYGYDYEITSGPNLFTDVLLPVGFGVGNQFDLWLDDGFGTLADSGIDLTGGIGYNFTDPLGISKFGIRGIDTALLLDPTDPLAFVTGLNFIDPGATVNMSQTAVTVFVADTVPAPTTLILLMSGMIGFAVRQRKA